MVVSTDLTITNQKIDDVKTVVDEIKSDIPTLATLTSLDKLHNFNGPIEYTLQDGTTKVKVEDAYYGFILNSTGTRIIKITGYASDGTTEVLLKDATKHVPVEL